MPFYISTVIGFFPLIMVWWLIQPKFFVFKPNATRMQVFWYSLGIWVLLCILLIFVMPNASEPKPELSNASLGMGFLSLFVLVVVCVLKANKNKKVVVMAEPILSPPPLPKAKKPKEKVAEKSIEIELGNEPLATIDYTNSEGEHAERPIIIKDVFISDNGYWQIKAIDTQKHATRQFRIDRIGWLEHNGYTFYTEEDILEAAKILKGWM